MLNYFHMEDENEGLAEGYKLAVEKLKAYVLKAPCKAPSDYTIIHNVFWGALQGALRTNRVGLCKTM